MTFPFLQSEIQDFINEKIGEPIAKLALQKNPFPNVEWVTILNQIEAKAKAKSKLPTWFASKNIIYPSKISIEQSSSEKTALYKSSLLSGKSLIDLTGGFGIDDYYFAQKFETVAHCELNTELSAIVEHNFKQLNVSNLDCYADDSYVILQDLNKKWDWIYIDPSRRNDAKGKVFMLADCLPNVPENIDFYFQFAPAILIKTAPLLDLSAGLSELKNVKKIHIVALENEVKELLWEIHQNYTSEITISTVNFGKNEIQQFDFILDDNQILATYNTPQKYLYEPNSALMKSGGFEVISSHFKIDKLHKHSHLYTSNEKIDFPGRIFEIENTIGYNKHDLKTHLLNQKANITTRNFPDNVESIRKKWKIKEGGNCYCFFTTDIKNNKIVLICKKI
ncbi:THUMP-like domain-containing protein [Flavobacterium agrisoli]|uniref:Class I SAM-dependent methyltransferase n=1 Tax=Flavobacterium agrisoli TaxID=2793066 RepID=A0A934PI20_9FLAO|nr:class I SAM-dependent methyltransferase [Flavobacterium agrisoli]MBK0368442.1 class I SAM-dependent methyltransferase [Flavobacterium agrisoli]